MNMLIPLLGTFAIATPGGGMTGNVYEVLLCVCDCAQLIAPGQSFCTYVCFNAIVAIESSDKRKYVSKHLKANIYIHGL